MPDMDLLSFPEMRDAVECCTAAAPGVLFRVAGHEVLEEISP